MRAGWLLLILLSQAVFAEDAKSYCSAKLGLEISPAGGDAGVKSTYEISCGADSYRGQITRIRTQLPYRTDEVHVSDSIGPLEPPQFDPPFYRITPQEKFTMVSVTPRNAIIIGGFSNAYSFSEAYSAKDSVRASGENSRIDPRDFLAVPELVVASEGSATSFQPGIGEYSVTLLLPEGAELKESTAPCKVERNSVKCEKLKTLEGLSISWREKSFPEKVMQKGWPWILLGVKSFFGGLF